MKRLLTICAVVALVLALGQTANASGQCHAVTVTWNVPGDFNTIQDAIDSNDVLEGHIILVAAGSHAGATVTKAVEIRGESGAVINSGPKPWAARPLMAGFLFASGGGGDGATISNLLFETVEFPVFSRGADDVTVSGCTLANPIQGITNWHGSRWEISRNVIRDLRSLSGGGIGIFIGCCLGGVSNDNVISRNKITGTLHVSAGDCGGYNGSGIVLYADYRWGYPGADEIAYNRVVKNTVSLVSDTPDVVDVVGIELTDTRDDETLDPVIFGNTVAHNDLRGTVLQIALTPENLDEVNQIRRNRGDNRHHGMRSCPCGHD